MQATMARMPSGSYGMPQRLMRLGDNRDDGEDEEGAGERMRDQQRQHKGEREDRDDERLGVAHELEHERIGDAIAQARLLDRAGNEVGADDEPHGGLGPRAKRGGDRRRDARGARYRTPLTLRCVAAIQSSGFFGWGAISWTKTVTTFDAFPRFRDFRRLL